MRLIATVLARAFAVAALAFVAARIADGAGSGACAERRDRCRTACFDKFATRDEAAFARCKETCNREWLACSGGGR